MFREPAKNNYNRPYELGHGRYSRIDGTEKEWTALTDAEVKEVAETVERETTNLVFLQILLETDEDESVTISILVDDVELGYLEVLDYWKGTSDKNIL